MRGHGIRSELEALCQSTAAAWEMAIGAADDGIEDEARAEAMVADCRDSAEKSGREWIGALAAVDTGDRDAAREALARAKQLASPWGDDSFERQALRILEAK